MHLTAWATLAAILVYAWTGYNAGKARVTYQVKAPSMDGPPGFQCCQRVQANTLEQLPLLLAPLWMCASFLGDAWAAGGGLLWCVGRIWYALAYYKDPATRTGGYMTSSLACMYLMVGSAAGLLIR
ncbi:MAG: MAPEG family protein [Pseudomonadota bacterium]